MKKAATLWVVASCLFAASSASAGTVCVGDCNGDGSVAINELITGVNIALGAADVENSVDMLRARGLEFAGERLLTRPVSDRPTLCFEIVQG